MKVQHALVILKNDKSSEKAHIERQVETNRKSFEGANWLISGDVIRMGL